MWHDSVLVGADPECQRSLNTKSLALVTSNTRQHRPPSGQPERRLPTVTPLSNRPPHRPTEANWHAQDSVAMDSSCRSRHRGRTSRKTRTCYRAHSADYFRAGCSPPTNMIRHDCEAIVAHDCAGPPFRGRFCGLLSGGEIPEIPRGEGDLPLADNSQRNQPRSGVPGQAATILTEAEIAQR